MTYLRDLGPAWKPIDSAPADVLVMTKIDEGGGLVRNVQPLRLNGRLWFLADGSMYVYYRPTHWREINTTTTTRNLTQDHHHE